MRKGKSAAIILLALCLCLWSCAPKREEAAEPAESAAEPDMEEQENVSAGDGEKEEKDLEEKDEKAPEEAEKSGIEEKSADGRNSGSGNEAADTGRPMERGKENRSREPKPYTQASSSPSGEKKDENSSQGSEASAGDDLKEDPAEKAEGEVVESQFAEGEGEGDYDF